jgi:hypothetical protein
MFAGNVGPSGAWPHRQLPVAPAVPCPAAIVPSVCQSDPAVPEIRGRLIGMNGSRSHAGQYPVGGMSEREERSLILAIAHRLSGNCSTRTRSWHDCSLFESCAASPRTRRRLPQCSQSDFGTLSRGSRGIPPSSTLHGTWLAMPACLGQQARPFYALVNPAHWMRLAYWRLFGLRIQPGSGGRTHQRPAASC